MGFDPASYVVNETAGSVELTVRIVMGSLERSAVVNYLTIDGTATAASPFPDYGNQSGPLTFSPGVLFQRFSIPIVDDIAVEDPESFFASLTTMDDSVTLSPDNAMITILQVPGDDGK